jgi:proteasome activator subunit 4
MKREIRAKLALLYYQLATLPGMDSRTVELAASMTMLLIESKKRIDIDDLVLPWKPLYHLLEKELVRDRVIGRHPLLKSSVAAQFPKKRSTGKTAVAGTLLNLAAEVQRFFPPHEAPEMLSTFLPRLNGTKLDTIIATQAFMIHFLPLSHPTSWLPAVFRLWESFNSTVWDEQCVLASSLETSCEDLCVQMVRSAVKIGRIAHQPKA